MRVYLVQHAECRAKEEDPERGLSEEGIASTRWMSRWATARSFGVPSIFHSGKTRARQTAELLAGGVGATRVEAAEGLGPLDPPETAAAWIKTQDEDLMLVGHLPHLERLTSLLTTGDPERGAVRFHNAGIVCLEGSGDQWSLIWTVIPDLVREAVE